MTLNSGMRTSVAPQGGNAELGITDGFGIGGDFYDDGELLAEGEFEVDLERFCFEVALDIPKLELGPIDLSDVVIDIRIAQMTRISRLLAQPN